MVGGVMAANLRDPALRSRRRADPIRRLDGNLAADTEKECG
jgi:hypothetical protein